MDLTVENISGLLIRSKLLSPEEVRAVYQRWQGEGGEHAASTGHYLRWMVAQKYLTEYQAALIGRGQADAEFFFLDQYQIVERLGKGRMAGVYKAVHRTGQTVAIKVLPPSKARDPQLLARFQREARLAMKLKHPNIVRTFQTGEAGGLHYLVMEYLEGETLEEALRRRKKLPPNESVRLVHQALQGLQHICDQGLVHRDLKPANLMLVPAGAPGGQDTSVDSTVKILDIGLGRELFDEGPAGAGAGPPAELTTEGTILGTPDYLAPEQAKDARSCTIAADIYSLGCVLYHCLAGRPPFPDTNILNQLVRHATEEPRPVTEFTPECPEGLQQVLGWMLAKDPARRYPTPARAAQALQVFMVAGAEVQPIEASPQMRKYITYLETGDRGETKPAGAQAYLPGASADGPAAAAPARAPTPPPPPAARAGAPGEKKRPRDKKRRPEGNSVPVAPPAAGSPLRLDDFDVELVAAAPAAAPPPAGPAAPPAARPGRGWLALSVRDWLMMGVGASAVILAVLAGWVLALFF